MTGKAPQLTCVSLCGGPVTATQVLGSSPRAAAEDTQVSCGAGGPILTCSIASEKI
jgi:hypothetical protein